MTVSLPAGYDHQIYPELDSTNEEAKRQISGNQIVRPTWIQAQTQTAGRGRRGQSWTSEPGNLFCSLALPLERDLSEAANLSFAAALAVAGALEPHVDPAKLQFKWPNDVLLEQQKIAGILLEVQRQGEVPWLIIGIGVNVSSAPANVQFPATALSEVLEEDVSVDVVMTGLAGRFADWLTVWRTQGFAPVREAWLKRAARINMDISVRLPHETLSGSFMGLDDDGGLRLRLADGDERRITAGDIFFDV